MYAINVAENVCNLRLLVFDIDVLLGLNWFKVSGAGLYPSLKLLKFGDTTKQLSNKQNVIFNWDDNCNKAFSILKDKLTSYPILQQPDFAKKFVLHCDASGYALGVILCQIDSGDINYFNTECVISCASRILKNAEINYGITQKECLSILWGVKQFHTYLYGIKFVVVTDHIALSWLNHTPPQNGRLARWAMYLQEYQFDVVYRKGTLHSNVDAISRPVLTVSILNNNEIDDNDDNKNIEAYNDSYLTHYLKFKTHLPGASKRQLKRIMRLVTKYKLDLGSNTLYYRKNENVEYVKILKIDERSGIIERAHLQGHFNAQSTLQRILMQYYWVKMAIDVINFVNKCLKCKRINKCKVFHHPARPIKVLELFERIAMDLVLGHQKILKNT
jgi:hypothetical protein